MTTGEKIKRLRRKQNMSQEQLANTLGLSRQAVSRWETENSLPDTAVIIKLSELFHVTTDYLLKEEGPGMPLQEGEIEPPRKPPPADLIIGIVGTAVALVFFLIVLFLVLNPRMTGGAFGIHEISDLFLHRNELLPFAIIIGVAFCVGMYHLIKLFLYDWQPK